MTIEGQFIHKNEHSAEDKESENVALMEHFIEKCLEDKKRGDDFVSLEKLRSLKERGISTEKFLNYLCDNHGRLLHGSIQSIDNKRIKPNNGKIFASNESAISILKSLYSNKGATLNYSYFISEENPLVLKIKTDLDIDTIKSQRGFVYILDKEGFVNDPEGSWQFSKNTEADIQLTIEIEESDFVYPIHVIDEVDSE